MVGSFPIIDMVVGILSTVYCSPLPSMRFSLAKGGDGSGGVNKAGVSPGSLDSLTCSEITCIRGSPTIVEASEIDITKKETRALLLPPKKRIRGDLLTYVF